MIIDQLYEVHAMMNNVLRILAIIITESATHAV